MRIKLANLFFSNHIRLFGLNYIHILCFCIKLIGRQYGGKDWSFSKTKASYWTSTRLATYELWSNSVKLNRHVFELSSTQTTDTVPRTCKLVSSHGPVLLRVWRWRWKWMMWRTSIDCLPPLLSYTCADPVPSSHVSSTMCRWPITTMTYLVSNLNWARVRELKRFVRLGGVRIYSDVSGCTGFRTWVLCAGSVPWFGWMEWNYWIMFCLGFMY